MSVVRPSSVRPNATGTPTVDPAAFRARLASALDPSARAGRDDAAARPGPRSGPLLVAVSGGLDSCVLLHAARFGPGGDAGVVAAHFDHAMRAGSAGDAAWVAGVCRAWSVPLHAVRAEEPPASEDEARAVRYAFLIDASERLGARAIATAHHADDQAETVLFRILRGTGVRGLTGIPASRAPGIVRPFLGVWREELLGYARAAGLRWRDDPTNDELGPARNVLRHVVLPVVERNVAPGARRALVRLASLAEQEETAWGEAVQCLLRVCDATDDSLAFDAVASMGAPLRARVLRVMSERNGARLDRATTDRAVHFAASGRSGTGIELGGGVELRRELDRLVWVHVGRRACEREEGHADAELVVRDPGPGQGWVRLGGRVRSVRWWPGPAAVAPSAETDATTAVDRPLEDPESGVRWERTHFRLAQLRFPLRVRARRPGDRIRRSAGSTKVGKLMLEARVPAHERDAVPVVVDADDGVVWVTGIEVDRARTSERPGRDTMMLEIER